MDATGSTPGEPGGPSVTSYAWTIGGAGAGSSGTFYHAFPSSTSVSLAVTDADGVTGNAAGSVTVNALNECDDPLTPLVEDCSTNPPSGTVSGGGSNRDEGVWHGMPSLTYVCYVTDWYQWNGSGWTYTNTTIDYCTWE
jgi:hypothetical protein